MALTRLATTKLSNTETVTRVLDILCEEPGRSDAWPMHVQWRGDEALYSVDPETAALWKSVRS
jgi:hypothetical protein